MTAYTDRVTLLRRYVFEYVIGTLWTLALLTLFLSEARAASTASVFVRMNNALHGLHAPESVLVVVAVVAGFVGPYCLCVAFTPVTFLLMNEMPALQRRVFGPQEASFDTFATAATEKVQRAMAVSGPITNLTKMMFVEKHDPHLGAYLRHLRDELVFRMGAVLPVSLLCAAAICRLTAGVLWTVIAVVVGLAVFATGSWFANDAITQTAARINTAVLLTQTDISVPTKN